MGCPSRWPARRPSCCCAYSCCPAPVCWPRPLRDMRSCTASRSRQAAQAGGVHTRSLKHSTMKTEQAPRRTMRDGAVGLAPRGDRRRVLTAPARSVRASVHQCVPHPRQKPCSLQRSAPEVSLWAIATWLGPPPRGLRQRELPAVFAPARPLLAGPCGCPLPLGGCGGGVSPPLDAACGSRRRARSGCSAAPRPRRRA